MSFSDLMSSGRGPGVIGMLMALFVLLGFGLLFMFAFDEGLQGSDQSIESIISHQEREIDGAKVSISRGMEALGNAPAFIAANKELISVKRENQYRQGRIDSLRQGIADAQEAVAAKTAEFEAYKDNYRAFVRGRAKGQVIDRLETRKGAVFENVTIREVTPVGMQIRHDGGMRRIAFEDLPAELQEQFQFDPKQKAAAMAQERAERIEHEAAVSAASEMVNRQSMERKQKEEDAAREAAVRAIEMKRSRIKSLSEEIRVLNQALRVESRKGISRAPQMRAQLAAKQREMAALEADVARAGISP